MGWEIPVKITADGTGFARGLKTAEGQAKGFSDTLAGLGARFGAIFSVASVTSAIRSTVNYVTHLKDLAEQQRISTAEVQRLDIAARSLGLTEEDAAVGLTKIAHARREAINGNEEMRESFRAFGVSLDDLKDSALRPLDLFQQMAEAIRGKDLGTTELEMLASLVGDKLTPKMASLLEAMEAASKQPIISDDAIDNIDRADKALEALERRAKGFGALGINRFLGGTTGNELTDQAVSAGIRVVPMLQLFGFLAGKAAGVNQSDQAGGEGAISPALPLPKGRRRRGTDLQADANVLMALRDQLHGLELAGMDPEARRQALVADLMEARRNEEMAPDDVARLKARVKRLGIENQIKGLDKHLDSPASPLFGTEVVRDSLAAIGGGSANTSAIAPITSLLDKVVMATEKTAENTKKDGRFPRRFP